jgi:hypothetical protein
MGQVGGTIRVATHVDAGHDDLSSSRGDELAGVGPNLFERHRAGHTSRVGDDAVRAECVAAVLHLEQRAGPKRHTRPSAHRGACRRQNEQVGDQTCDAGLVRLHDHSLTQRGEGSGIQRRAAAGDHDRRRTGGGERMPDGLAVLRVSLAGHGTRAHDHHARLGLINDLRAPAQKLGSDRLALDAIDLAAESAKRHAERNTHCDPPIPPSAAIASASDTTAAV